MPAGGRHRFVPRLLLCATFCASNATGAASVRPNAREVGIGNQAADVAASGLPPLEARLATYLAILEQARPAPEISAFLVGNPVWPNRQVLRARLGQALLGDPDDREAAAICAVNPPSGARALLRCAVAARAEGSTPLAIADARTAWAQGIDAAPGEAAAEGSFLADWGFCLGPDDEWQRFSAIDHPASAAAARRQVARLDAAHRALATALLALDEPQADPVGVAGSVPAPLDIAPALVLEVSRALRLAARWPTAVAYWSRFGDRAEASAGDFDARRLGTERNALARDLLASGDPGAAFRLLEHDTADADPGTRAGNLFLAGWIALRKLGRPAVAAARFEAMRAATPSLITASRAAFWLSKVDEANGDRIGELANERLAGAIPTTFYGQQALARIEAQTPGPVSASASDAGGNFLASLRSSLLAVPVPRPTRTRADLFAAGELPRAAAILVSWGQSRRAGAFVALAESQAADAVGHAEAASLALRLDLPAEAVAIARRAGSRGIALPTLGWPAPIVPPPDLPPGLVLGIVRQESGFDPNATSPHGARGLMQLMPATAGELARRNGTAVSATGLTEDPALNLRLGSLYLVQLLARFDQVQPLAIAAYNAGPGRVGSWIDRSPPPVASAGLDPYLVSDPMIDWIELIPTEETRNYVQRVLADTAIYASNAHVTGTIADAVDVQVPPP